jgi:predicted ArsR family transcriptional regulator
MAEKNSDRKSPEIISKKILSLLQTDTLSTRDISEEIGSTYATTLKYLEMLRASDLIDNKIFGKTKVWYLKKEEDPFELDLFALLYLLIKDLAMNSQSYDTLINILNSFYLKGIELNRNKLKIFAGIELIKKYTELEKDLKWEKIEGYYYDASQTNSNTLEIKLYGCEYKFACCAHLNLEHIDICCIMGQKFPCLLRAISNEDYKLQLVEFSLDPSICVIHLDKSE